MGWQDILKSAASDYDNLLDKLVDNVHFFNPDIERSVIEGPYIRTRDDKTYLVTNILNPLIKTLEFMRAAKDDLEFRQRSEVNATVEYNFEMYGLKCSIVFDIHTLGVIARDNHIKIGKNLKVCVRPRGTMTKGDFLTTLVLGIRSNAIPNIMKFVAYTLETGFLYGPARNKLNIIYDYDEEEYKIAYVEYLIESEKVTGDEEDRWVKILNKVHIASLDSFMLEQGVPKEVLGKW